MKANTTSWGAQENLNNRHNLTTRAAFIPKERRIPGKALFYLKIKKLEVARELWTITYGSQPIKSRLGESIYETATFKISF